MYHQHVPPTCTIRTRRARHARRARRARRAAGVGNGTFVVFLNGGIGQMNEFVF